MLNRETGEPLFPVEERLVTVSDVAGEQTWPKLLFPIRAKPYSLQQMTEDDRGAFSTPASHDSLLKTFRRLHYEGLFTPSSIKGSLNFPRTIGGLDWGGTTYNPNTCILYLKSNE